MVKELSINAVWDILKTVSDPEIPSISIVDLGIVRDVQFNDDILEVIITPTYSGCPAMLVIKNEIIQKLESHKISNFQIKTNLSPPWTTDWMSAEVKNKLKNAGIAPPSNQVVCPQCDSLDVKVISNFGSTACKALCKCNNCEEPFHHFKKF
jgi:ring-1,2-phenylacetyl-CoA epoxidase subunit PaaD